MWKNISGPIATSSYATYFTDIDGDGRIDLLLAIEGGTSALLGSGDGKFTDGGGFSVSGGAKSYNLADINGDGKTDVCAVKTDNTSWCGLSMGDTGFTTPISGFPSRGIDLFADVNGDGITDRIATDSTGNSLVVILNSGDNGYNYDLFNQVVPTSPDLPPGSPYSSAGYQLLFADFDGDGREDMIVVDKANNKSFWGQSKYPTAGKIVSITDAFGAVTTINYKFLNDAGVYTPDADATGTLRDAIYPLLGLQRAPTVVSSTSTSNGIGGTLNTTFTYGGLKTDLTRRETLGFRWVQAVQQETGIATRTDYRQDWPLVGQVASSKRTIPGGGNNGVLGQTAYTFACTDFVSVSGCSVAPGRRYFPYVTQSVTSSWDLNGAPLPLATSTYQFDAFGNPTQVVESTSDGFSKTTTTTYTNDTAKWWIGLPTRQTVRSDSP